MTKKAGKQLRINAILDAAIQEFVDKGYENAGMDAIAARAGLSKGGLYYHFKSKDELLISANQRFMEPVERLMEAAIQAESAAEGLSRYIRGYLEHWGGHDRELSFVLLSMAKSITCPGLTQLYDGYTAGMADLITALYSKGHDLGEFRPCPAQALALALSAALDGISGYLAVDSRLEREQTISDLIMVFVTQYTGGAR